MHFPFDSHHLVSILVTFLSLILPIFANTEIINIHASPSQDVLMPESLWWDVLTPKAPQRLLEVPPAPLGSTLGDICEGSHPGSCPHEKWLVLDLDDPTWTQFTKFTIRISWPASSPAEFSIETFSPATFRSRFYGTNHSAVIKGSASTRRQYARVRVLDTGVRTPLNLPDSWQTSSGVEPIPFNVLLEPLYFGFLPKSVVPILLFLLPLVVVSVVVVAPAVNSRLNGVAEDARMEFITVRRGGKEDKKDE